MTTCRAPVGKDRLDREPDARSSELPITQRQTIARDVSTVVLDALLMASCSVPASASLGDAVTTLLRAVTELFPNIALGAQLSSPGAAALVVRCSAHPLAEPSTGSARLFPDYASERTFIPDFAEGLTLHLACDDAAFIAEATARDALLDRLGRVLQAAIERARGATRADAAVIQSLRSQVAHSERLASVGQIAASIVHELNNPLTSIVAYSDFLWKKGVTAGSDASDVERLARINEAAERILRFSRDLTAYARPTSEGPAPIVIHDVLDRALVFCEHILSQTHVVAERSYGDVGRVSAVRSQLTQVFVNLFTNACQAMDPIGGKLTIATGMTADRRSLSIRVGDEGHGIKHGDLERIFDPFFTTHVDGTGTGLGLSIVYNIVQSHGGRVFAERGEPTGAVFVVELPALTEP